MAFELFKLEELSIGVTSFYSVYYNESEDTLYYEFLNKYINILMYKKKMKVATLQLKSISNYKGAMDHFFIPHDPYPDDRVCYLNFGHWLNARLFCIRYSESLVVLGSGGLVIHGRGSITAKKLIDKEQKKMKQLSILIQTKLDLGELRITPDGKDFTGNFKL